MVVVQNNLKFTEKMLGYHIFCMLNVNLVIIWISFGMVKIATYCFFFKHVNITKRNLCIQISKTIIFLDETFSNSRKGF